jgi:hypothetical protein
MGPKEAQGAAFQLERLTGKKEPELRQKLLPAEQIGEEMRQIG